MLLARVTKTDTDARDATTRPEGVPVDAVDISDDGGLCKHVLESGDAMRVEHQPRHLRVVRKRASKKAGQQAR